MRFPLSGRARDFHPLDYAHVGRTNMKSISEIEMDFFVVCSARALSNGCKSRVSLNSGNYIAKGKGVHREVKSERSRWQTSDLTYRNFIQGI